MARTENIFMVRESFGTYGITGPPFQNWERLKADSEETRFTFLSRDGNYFGIGKASMVNIYKIEDGSLHCSVRHRMLSAQLSPQNGYLIAWDNPGKGNHNFNIWSLNGDSKTPKVVHSLKMSKLPEVQFSADDKIYALLSNDGRILFYETPNFHEEKAATAQELNISNFSLSPGSGPLHFIGYIHGGKQGGPSYIRMWQYPNLSVLIAQRSSFQSDRVKIKWNKRGTAALVITMTDVDKTGGSYYGKTSLEYLNTKGESYRVQLSGGTDADGKPCHVADLHACEWSPNSSDFCVIVGKMPNTRAALMNSKGDKIFDMGIAARNEIYFNPQGNLVLICGLGNLPGTIEVWDIKAHKKCIAKFRAQNATQVEWLKDGAHFITATTAPRMQVDNGYTVWDFTGKQVHQWKAQKHLFEITSFAKHGKPIAFPDGLLEEHLKSGGKVKINAEAAPAYIPIHKRRGVVGITSSGKGPQPNSSSIGAPVASTTELSPNEKKIRNLKKKIQQIEKLKSDRDAGITLQLNQIEKIQGEDALRKELETLEL